MEKLKGNLSLQRVILQGKSGVDRETEAKREKEREEARRREQQRQEALLDRQIEEMAQKMADARSAEIKRLRTLNKERMHPLTQDPFGLGRPRRGRPGSTSSSTASIAPAGGDALAHPAAYLTTFVPNVGFHLDRESHRMDSAAAAAASAAAAGRPSTSGAPARARPTTSASAAAAAMAAADDDNGEARPVAAARPSDGAGPRNPEPAPGRPFDDVVVSAAPEVAWSPRRGLRWTAPVGLRPTDGGLGRSESAPVMGRKGSSGRLPAGRQGGKRSSPPGSAPRGGIFRLSHGEALDGDSDGDASDDDGSDGEGGGGGIFAGTKLEQVYLQRPPTAPAAPKLVTLTPLARSLQPPPEALRPNVEVVGLPFLAGEDKAGFDAALNGLTNSKGLLPEWHKPSAEVLAEADSFDGRHYERTGRALRFTKAANRGGQSYQGFDAKLMVSLHDSVRQVRMNRYIQPHVAEQQVVYRGGPSRKKAVAKHAWSVYTSIWGPRASWCDAKDVWDTSEAFRARYVVLWSRLLDLGLSDLVLKNDDGDGEDSDSNATEEDAALFGDDNDTRDDHPEVADVKRVLWTHHDVSEAIFSYYACVSPSDLDTWGMIEWSLFLGDFEIANKKSKLCKTADL